ncbi:MAG: acetyl-CoA carboxylase carboxyl transferase subunit alpha/beta [Deltaproteobacteria bacterium]|jgi:acetyl-CoA carboxylase carboxyl transferase subunit beta|nr:acetyl-CoA carboxylase carboxyl transferase subunit alpha/beta [Deltaproteobacteria bacterium]
MDTDKKLQQIMEQHNYMRDILAGKNNENLRLLSSRVEELQSRLPALNPEERRAAVDALADLFSFVEKKLEAELTPMDKAHIVRHPQRVCLRDILENVYDNYTEIGSMGEHSIDPAILIARAYITRRQGRRILNQSVMVIGHEKGHGEEIRNGGSVKPWGNAKALHYMKVAETENIPIHTYVFTPGSFPTEDTPGAAQQIAKNLYEMSNLRVPVLAIISEGGSGGAEAVALADKRLMFSHGYYSVISPEGAAAIEGNLKEVKGRASAELIEDCALNLRITAEDNLRMGYVDEIIQEPPLGARGHNFDFFRLLRQEVLRATDEIVLSVRGIEPIRYMALRSRRKKAHAEGGMNMETVCMRWNLSSSAQERLVDRRHRKFRALSLKAHKDTRGRAELFKSYVNSFIWEFVSYVKYDLLRRRQQGLSDFIGELQSETSFFVKKQTAPALRFLSRLLPFIRRRQKDSNAAEHLTTLSLWDDAQEQRGGKWAYISPRAKDDRTVTCPNAATHGCLDMWSPDLFGEFAGVCSNCGHHFPMEYQWYLYNVFDRGSIHEFNAGIEAVNPLAYPGFDLKLDKAKAGTGQKSSCLTFEASINGIKLVTAMLIAPFRGGSVGATEGEKFILAAERASKKRYPLLAYVHGTAGIRIQEGTNGLIQMPRCTMAVRRYVDAGGLYLVVYDTNSYAGPVASFLGCSPYQFGIRSSNIGFAGYGVIKETTGEAPPPHYHNVFKAIARGHIHGIWDRRETRFNLYQAMLTMGGRNLYYK